MLRRTRAPSECSFTLFWCGRIWRSCATPPTTAAASGQGLTLVDFSDQHKRFLWNRGCVQGLFRGCSRGIMG